MSSRPAELNSKTNNSAVWLQAAVPNDLCRSKEREEQHLPVELLWGFNE